MQTLREAPSYAELVRAWKALNGKRGLSVREIECANTQRTMLCAEMGPPGRPLICLTAGMHGDEPAAPWALFSIVRDGLLNPGFAYRIWPCVNPTGYVAGTRCNEEGDDINRSFHHGGCTPEARTIIEASRSQRFLLQIDMHEDPEADGFYCYEPACQPGGFHGLAVVEAILRAGLPLQEMHAGFDLGYDVETLQLERGRVLYDPVESAATMSGLPLNVYFFCRRTAERVTTFETPGRRAWDERIEMHRLAVVSAIHHMVRFGGLAA